MTAASQDWHRRWQETTLQLGARSDYKAVWDRQARDPEIAKLAVAGYGGETEFEAAAMGTRRVLQDAVGFGPHDIVLEIGCGVGRMGRIFSETCLHWIGTDISGEMLKHAGQRLAGCPNVTLIELAEVGLREIPDNTIDLVYCTVVFMHLYEWDRFRYVQEALRVLRPGGRCYFDNMDITAEPGWRMFQESARYPAHARPAHLSMASTGEELHTYARRAGFASIRVHRLPQGWVAVSGRKPSRRPE